MGSAKTANAPDKPGWWVTPSGSPSFRELPVLTLLSLLLNVWVSFHLTLDSQSLNLWRPTFAPGSLSAASWPHFLIQTCVDAFFCLLSLGHGQQPLASLDIFPLWDLLACSHWRRCHRVSLAVHVNCSNCQTSGPFWKLLDPNSDFCTASFHHPFTSLLTV